MSNDVKKTIIYSETKLINHLKEELDKSKDTNYQLCLKYMKNLGQLSAQKDKEIEDASYNLLFSCISTIFRRADKPNVVPLALRIISLKVLTNTALILFERQHVNPSSVAYSLIIKEISNEVVKPNYSVSFLITIFDAIFLCSQARCVDDKATVAALLTLGKISRNLRPGAKDSLAIALDIDLIPFNQNYKYGSSIKDINRILQEIGCIRLPSDNVIPQASQIPQPKNITSLETRLAAQEFLMQQNPDELAKRVMDGFKRFTKIEGYRKPDTIDDLIAILIEGPAEDLDEQSLIVILFNVNIE
ncbi:hypothetical protein TRFO_18185 [Tritrichomonas foetus]|uniref:Uncharacterized protein n=1 Tax=Tritrichomonas foetus TaxID=1144522 RepID=A0A1J4KLK1_9EUKA|nr:hypothetical protein TRFO_18185 [Tritrichomonas foetus]|eukprot:OHT12177.1 hypothetical protein TRFO_18185 [Tritrichomonas foetus]